MRDSNGRLSHADIINRRARYALVAVLVVVGVVLVMASGDGATGPDTESAAPFIPTTALDADTQVSRSGTPPTTSVGPDTSFDQYFGRITGTTLPLDPVAPLPLVPGPPDGGQPEATTTTNPPPVTATTSTTTTTTAPPTTTSPPPPTTVPPTTTTPPPTTTLPPTTTTTAPPAPSWDVVLDANLSCENSNSTIRWLVYNPSDAWSAGWTMIIDSDSRGVFTAGTSVTSGPAASKETVPNGSHTITVTVHWEQEGVAGGSDSGSLTVVVDGDCGG